MRFYRQDSALINTFLDSTQLSYRINVNVSVSMDTKLDTIMDTFSGKVVCKAREY